MFTRAVLKRDPLARLKELPQHQNPAIAQIVGDCSSLVALLRFDRQAGRLPGLETADEVGGVDQAEVL